MTGRTISDRCAQMKHKKITSAHIEHNALKEDRHGSHLTEKEALTFSKSANDLFLQAWATHFSASVWR